MGTLVTLAQLDPDTQARATTVFNELCAVYGLAAGVFRADEVGTAARDAAATKGAADEGFPQRMWDLLLFRVHLKMGQHGERGEDLPSTLPAAKYALLRKGLTARFGPLPDAAPALAESDGPGTDSPSPDERAEELLRARVV